MVKRRASVTAVAFLSAEQRCHQLEAWAAALGWELLGSCAGRACVLKARVQPLQGCLMVEELYPARLSVGWRDPCGRASLLLVQHGRCIVETLAAPDDGAQAPLLLRADGRNGALLVPAVSYRLTVSQAPCRLLRLVLPSGSRHPAGGSWSVELGLMLPMLRLLEQALRHPGGAARRGELGATLLGYLLHQLAEAGCAITLADAGGDPAAASHTDPALLPRLEEWLRQHLEQPLQLADLAAAMALSPRRLQELCRLHADCTPMEVLRRLRLESLAESLRDPRHQSVTLASLMARLQLPNSAATRHTFARLFGVAPANYHRKPMETR